MATTVLCSVCVFWEVGKRLRSDGTDVHGLGRPVVTLHSHGIIRPLLYRLFCCVLFSMVFTCDLPHDLLSKYLGLNILDYNKCITKPIKLLVPFWQF